MDKPGESFYRSRRDWESQHQQWWLGRIGGTSGELKGAVSNTAFTNVSSLTPLQSENLDISDVNRLNSGTIVGTYNGFGGTNGVGLFTAVPEPSSVLGALSLGLAYIARFRKRRR